MAKVSQSENTAERLDAMEFDVVTIDGNDMDAFLDAYDRAKAGRQRQTAGDHRQDPHRQRECRRWRAPRKPTAKAARSTETRRVAGLGLPKEHYYVFPEVTEYFSELKKSHDAKFAEWIKKFDAWKEPPIRSSPMNSPFHSAYSQTLPKATQEKTADVAGLFAVIPEFPGTAK